MSPTLKKIMGHIVFGSWSSYYSLIGCWYGMWGGGQMSVVCILIWGQMSYILFTRGWGGGGKCPPLPILWGPNVMPFFIGGQMSECVCVCVWERGRGRLRDCSKKKKQFFLGRFSQSDFFFYWDDSSGAFIRAPNESVKSAKPCRRDHHQSCQLCRCEKKKKKKKNALRNAKKSFFEKTYVIKWLIWN